MDEKDFLEYFDSKYPRTSSFTSGIALMVVDCLGVMLSIGIAFFLINAINHSWINFRSFVTYWVYLPPAMCVYYAAGLYPGIVLPPADEVKKFCICTFFIFMGIALSIAVEDADDKWPIVVALILAVPFATIILPGGREVARHIFANNKWYGVPAVIFVNGKSGNFIIDRLLNRKDFGYKPAVIVDSSAIEPDLYKEIPIVPLNNSSLGLLKKVGIKVAIIAGFSQDTKVIHHRFRYVLSIPKIQDTESFNLDMRDIGGILAYYTTNNLTKQISLTIKRAVDLFLLLLASPILVPIVVIVSLIVKLSSPGPIFYGHKRVGKDGKEFKCWKFRSMVINADKMLDKILAEHPEMREEWEKDRKFTNDPRVTRIGKLLRRTSIDEIPQFFNVLTGEMSFIGPRPVTEPELKKYGRQADYILSVQPGLSGMWQISGRSDTGYEERVTLDSYYIQNWSVWLDLWIIIKTLYVVVKGKGAY